MHQFKIKNKFIGQATSKLMANFSGWKIIGKAFFLLYDIYFFTQPYGLFGRFRQWSLVGLR